MTSAFETNSIFLWLPSEVGPNERIASLLVEAGFQSVMLHVENLSLFNGRFTGALIGKLKEAGLAVIGSSAVYGTFPADEGKTAARLVNDWDLAGFVFDAESAFEVKPNADSNAVHILTNYKANTDKPSAWCSWAHFYSQSGAEWHPVKVVRAAMEYADFGMPMQYWNWGSSPDAAIRYTASSMEQWRRFSSKPIMPAGRAYNGDGGVVLAEAVTAWGEYIGQTCKGQTWWSMHHALRLDGIWDALTVANGGPLDDTDNSGTVIWQMLTTRNVRVGPGVSFLQVGQVGPGDHLGITELHTADGWIWGKIAEQRWVSLALANYAQVVNE